MAGTVILGSGGRLGAALQRAWGATGFTRAEVDITSEAALRAALEPLDFDVLVNCAAQTNVDRCETHPDEALAVNRDAVRKIAQICSAKNARCIHISTDYVFDGTQRVPYIEEDKASPISVYGESKLAGERALFEIDPEHLAVRVSWVFGPDRPSFVDQILERAKTSETVEAIGDKWAVPTYTKDIATLLKPFLRERREGGLLHLCNQGECTWQEYGQFALDCAREAGMSLRAHRVGSLKMADLKAFIAKRPVYTVLATSRVSGLTGQAPRSWQEAVREYVRERAAML
jgi:dTDP-4-dehydrorhamnose reductase